jgi:hypothetical protein
MLPELHRSTNTPPSSTANSQSDCGTATMSSQTLPLFDTRGAAHARVNPKKQEMYGRILGVARERAHFGLTADELAQRWTCSHNHVAPRISELAKQGKLIATGRTRLRRSGGCARVYILPEFA